MKPSEDLSKQERKLLKSQNRLIKLRNKSLKEFQNFNNENVTILCVRFGNKYGIEYVEKLRNMISRNISVEYQFVCLTDDSTPIKDVKLIVQPNAGYTKGWWHKIHMFDPKLPLQGRILYFDLDVIICGNIDKLIRFDTNKFLGIRDFNRKFHPSWKALNSSVMAWNHGQESYIWKNFIENKGAAMRLHGDQDWIWKSSKPQIGFFPDEWIQSYKWEIRRRDDLSIINGKRNFRKQNDEIKVPSECCVAVFHGDPNPADVTDKFVIDNWC